MSGMWRHTANKLLLLPKTHDQSKTSSVLLEWFGFYRTVFKDCQNASKSRYLSSWKNIPKYIYHEYFFNIDLKNIVFLDFNSPIPKH